MEHPNLGVEVYGKSCQHDQARVRVLRLCKKRLYVIRQNLILFYSIGWEDKQKDDTETFRSAIKTVLWTPLIRCKTSFFKHLLHWKTGFFKHHWFDLNLFLQTPLIRCKNSFFKHHWSTCILSFFKHQWPHCKMGFYKPQGFDINWFL